MKKTSLLFSIIITVISNSYSQKTYSTEKDIYEAKKIIFYGYDYTGFQLNDPKRLDEDIKKFVFTWIAFCQDHITEKKLARWLNKDTVTFNLNPTIALNKKLNSDDLGALTTHTISKDSIQSFINRYNLSEKEGIGFVVILESFDNKSKRVSGYYTFFDIATKKILMSDYDSSRNGNSYNRVSDWGAAVIIAVKKYTDIYLDKQKANN